MHGFSCFVNFWAYHFYLSIREYQKVEDCSNSQPQRLQQPNLRMLSVAVKLDNDSEFKFEIEYL
jgi:hypothetical protein